MNEGLYGFAERIEPAIPNPAGAVGRALVTTSSGVAWSYNNGFSTSFTGVYDLNNVNYFPNGSVPTLPNLTTVGPRFAVSTVSNGTSLSMATSDGWTVTQGNYAGGGGTFKLAAPAYTFTPHGLWSGGTLLPPLVSSGSIGGSAFNILFTLVLSPTQHVIGFNDSAANKLALVVYNPVTKLAGSVWFTTDAFDISQPSKIRAFALSSTGFVLFYGESVSQRLTIFPFSVSALTITQGTPYVHVRPLRDEALAQISPTSYVFRDLAGGATLWAVTVNSSTVTIGTAVDPGTPASSGHRTFLSPLVDGSGALLAYMTTGAGATSVTFRVAAVSGNTITLNTTYVSGDATFRGASSSEGTAGLRRVGSSHVLFSSNHTTPSTAQLVAATVSGTVVTIGTAATLTTGAVSTTAAALPLWDFPVAVPRMQFDRITRHDANTIVVKPAADTAVMYAVTATGTTVNIGPKVTFTSASVSYFAKDSAGNTYLCGNPGLFSRYTVSGNTIVIQEVVAGSHSIILRPECSDVAIKYFGTWYSWVSDSGASILPGASNSYPATPTTALIWVTGSLQTFGDIV